VYIHTCSADSHGPKKKSVINLLGIKYMLLAGLSNGTVMEREVES